MMNYMSSSWSRTCARKNITSLFYVMMKVRQQTTPDLQSGCSVLEHDLRAYLHQAKEIGETKAKSSTNKQKKNQRINDKHQRNFFALASTFAWCE